MSVRAIRLLSILALILAGSAAQAQMVVIPSIDSIDYSVMSAKTVAVATIGSIESKVSYERQVRFDVQETLKGSPQRTIDTAAYIPADQLNNWKSLRRRVLLTLRPGHPVYAPIELDNSATVVSTKDFKLLRTADEIVTYARKIVQEHPGSDLDEGFLIPPPDDDVGRQWKAVFGHQGSGGLRIPPDKRIERMALDKIASSDLNVRAEGLQMLRAFRTPQYVQLLMDYLHDPNYVTSPSGDWDRGQEQRYYPLRIAAYNVIGSYWRMDVAPPVTQETVSVVDTIENASAPVGKAEDDLDWLASATKLKRLRLVPLIGFARGFPDRWFSVLPRLTGLTSLDLSNLNLTDAQLAALRPLKNLERLILNGSRITDAGLRSLGESPNLREVSLADSEVTEDGLRALRTSLPEVNVTPSQPTTPINLYVKWGDLEGIKRILSKFPSAISQPDPAAWGNTPLHDAVVAQSTETIRYLLEHGASVDALNLNNETPLRVAASYYDPKIDTVKLLLRYGSDVNRSHPLDAALRTLGDYNYDVARLLLACGAEPPSDLSSAQAGTRKLELIRHAAEERKRDVFPVRQADATCRQEVYRLIPRLTNGWSTEALGALTGPIAWNRTPNGRQYFGPFGQQSVRIKLHNLPLHGHVKVVLDLFVIGSWDGNGGLGSGPDILDVGVTGRGTLLHSSFFNNTEGDDGALTQQSYPDIYPAGFHKGYTGAAGIRKLGFSETWAGKPYRRDAVYHIERTFSHAADALELVFSGLNVSEFGMRHLNEDERWGIGKLVVLVDAPVSGPDRSAPRRLERLGRDRTAERPKPAGKRPGTDR